MSSAIAPSMKTKPQKDYTLGEEIFNAVTHGVGALLAIAAIPLCVVQAVTHGAGLLLAAALIYSITMVVEYLMSTLYHAIAVPAAKRVFKVLDHCGIYLYIAGCYAPYCLVTLINNNGIPLCIFVWVVAACRYRCRSVLGESPRLDLGAALSPCKDGQWSCASRRSGRCSTLLDSGCSWWAASATRSGRCSIPARKR